MSEINMIEWDTPLGTKVRDIVTGFEGFTTGRLEYLNGCMQFCIKPRSGKSGRDMPDGMWVDSQQIEVIGDGLSLRFTRATPTPTGGPSADAPRGF